MNRKNNRERQLENQQNHQAQSNAPQEPAGLYRQILKRATESSPFRSLTDRRERAEKAKRLNDFCA